MSFDRIRNGKKLKGKSMDSYEVKGSVYMLEQDVYTFLKTVDIPATRDEKEKMKKLSIELGKLISNPLLEAKEEQILRRAGRNLKVYKER